MRWLSDLGFRLRALFRARAMRRDLDEELSFHLERETEKLLAEGMSPRAARREAYRRFGGVDRQREETRAAWGVRGLEDVGRDLRLGLRRMGRSPGFTLLATFTLALGIGGTSATFGMVDALLLRPLPYPQADRLVWMTSRAMVTPGNLDAWREGLSGSVELLGGFGLRGDVLVGRGAARNATYMAVSESYLLLLGARPALGRLWTPAEAAPGAAQVAVVSHRLWVEELGGEDLAGQSVTVGRTSYEVIGVLPPDFHNLGYDADLWLPISRALGSLNVLARLRPGATVASAQAEADALVARLDSPPGAAELGRSARVLSVRDRLAGDVRAPVLVLFAAAGLVLLLACANVTNLLLSRAAGRARELAVRSALGASRGALVRQLLVENAVLAVAGGTLGLVLAAWGLRAMVALAPPYLLRALVGGVRVEPSALAFTFGVAGLVTLLAGLAPALASTRAPGGATRHTSTRSHGRWREGLVAAEIALALIMLVGTALLVRTYLTLRPASPGFELEDRLVMELTLPGLGQVRYNLGPPPEDPANIELMRRLLRHIEGGSPGTRAAAVTSVPFSSVWPVRVVSVDERPIRLDDDGPVRIDLESATPSYMDVMGMRVTHGRGLAETDVRGAPHVVVVNQSAARDLWPDLESPVGRRLTLDVYGAGLPRPRAADVPAPAGPQTVELTVVGVVADVRSSGVHTGARPQAYVSYWQVPWPLVDVVVHAPGGGLTGESLRSAVAAIDRTVPVDDVTTIEAVAGRAVAQPRFETTLMTIFGVLAAALAVIGCYGVMACAVAQRTREIGVRMALGATRPTVVRAVLADGARVVAVGLAVGTLLAIGATRALEGSLYGVSPTDPATFALAAAALAAVSVGAAWLPARRASRVEPVLTLKDG